MVKIFGEFTVPIVRFLTKEEYATQLSQEGRARLRSLESFHDMENDPREDKLEGTGRLAESNVPFVRGVNQPVALEVVTTNPVYILCFSEASADLKRLGGELGSFVVHIDAPAILNRAVPDLEIESLPAGRQVVEVRIAQVRYDKDLVGEVGRDVRDAIPLAYTQKRPKDAYQREWRLAVVLSGPKEGAPEYILVRLPIASPLRVSKL